MKTQRKGMRAEHLALRWLENRGLLLIEKNFCARVGEIDLVMEHASTLVFVEVRYRSRQSHGGGAASVNAVKQRKLIKTAQYYLQSRHLFHRNARIDVLALSGTLEQPHYEWIRNAIEN